MTKFNIKNNIIYCKKSKTNTDIKIFKTITVFSSCLLHMCEALINMPKIKSNIYRIRIINSQLYY